MTLADAIHTLAVSGCRLTAGPDGGVALVVPDGAQVPREVLDVLTAHRAELVATVDAKPVPKARPSELREYLAEQGITGASADYVELVAKTFDVKMESITIEGEAAPAEPEFFEPGVPAITTVDALPVAMRGGASVAIPAGTLGLLVPQTWAIHDRRQREVVESVHDVLRRQGGPTHVPFWVNGEVHLVDARHITFEGAVAPGGMNLLPWRPQPQESLSS